MNSWKKGPFILRAMKTATRPGIDFTFWDGCTFMPISGTAEYCTLPENARRFASIEEAKLGVVEWSMRYPVVIGQVEVVDLGSAAWE